MPRARRKPKAVQDGEQNQVRGPNSALTQFLRDQGIDAETIRQRWLKSQEGKEASKLDNLSETDEKSAVGSEDGSPSVALDIDSVSEDDEDVELPADRLKRLRRTRHVSDSDEEEYEDDATGSRTVPETPAPHLTEAERAERAKKSKQKLLQRKRKKKKAANLLDRKTRSVSTLQDMCISQISANISKLQRGSQANSETFSNSIRESLGGISTGNLNKLARTLSKNRALNDRTLQLFLRTQLTELTFSDCSRISYEGYKLLAIFAPDLSHLSLQMCGQLNNEALLYIADKLPKLTSLYLDGPFLINEHTWDTFFGKMKGRLKRFHISNTHRFTDQCINSLLRNCGSDLTSLKLSRLDALSDYCLISQYLTNAQFEYLTLQYPSTIGNIIDEVLINILGQVGNSLKGLSLNGCSALTDDFLINGLSAFLGESGHSSQLETLELEGLDQITDGGMVNFLSKVSLPHLVECNFKRCSKLSDMALGELFLNKAQQSLVTLNLNSVKRLTKESFSSMHCPNLENLNLGFLGCVDDGLVHLICKQNEKLKILEVFGDNLVTSKAVYRKGVTIIGRQSDSF
ncbi:LAMI_0D10242g1_1 [Lachancea mirantina]|uniref:LAMI_0D10242g1_1 n=1 Tax=Lachancea mirantina TaxID=1230905 RepID=A0A1G4JE25_9SACH|nr:LAMI_0D10242g1_1 [Lachancea mirantina]